MTSQAVTAVDLARRLNIDPKRLRAWLRDSARGGHPLLQTHQHRDSWVFTPDEADTLARDFISKRVSARSGHAVVATAAATGTDLAMTAPGAATVVRTLASATPSASHDLVRSEVPATSGLYAWWLSRQALPGLLRDEAEVRSVNADLVLLYVGISGHLQQRLWGNHLHGNTGGSTLRRTLASLLDSQLDLVTVPSPSGDRIVLTKPSEAALTQWIKANLSLTWTTHPAPKEVESEVIRRMKPPCNLDHNSEHANYASMSSARATWRASAPPLP